MQSVGKFYIYWVKLGLFKTVPILSYTHDMAQILYEGLTKLSIFTSSCKNNN